MIPKREVSISRKGVKQKRGPVGNGIRKKGRRRSGYLSLYYSLLTFTTWPGKTRYLSRSNCPLVPRRDVLERKTFS